MFSETNYWHKNKYFIRSFIVLQAQKQVAPYAKFACLDACHLTGKFKGMLIFATNQDSNGTIFILAHGLVPREDGENSVILPQTLSKCLISKFNYILYVRQR